MTPEERLNRIEQDIDKHNEAIRGLIVAARTCLDSIQELREVQRKDHEDWTAQMKDLRDAQSTTEEKLNVLVDTVDRIIRHRNGKE